MNRETNQKPASGIVAPLLPEPERGLPPTGLFRGPVILIRSAVDVSLVVLASDLQNLYCQSSR